MKNLLLIAVVLLLASCGGATDKAKKDSTPDAGNAGQPTTAKVVRPVFDGENAYQAIQQQVDFGPRVPGTDAHKDCAEWLEETLGQYTDRLIVQETELTAWDKRALPCYNIIGSFNPESAKRVMLCAHWDTRPVADEDTDRKDEPIDGANDGGSGVGVLLELARVLKENPLDYGVDIIFFDVEDYGKAEHPNSYCLGSQYWAANLHEQGYNAEYGILLDMVGARDAYFYREGISMYYAPDIVQKVWDAAARAGARSWFQFNNEPFPQLTDDHLYVNRIAGIRTIDIIQYDQNTEKGFGEFWHTHNDNMDIIDRSTLNAVGKTLVEVLYSENEI